MADATKAVVSDVIDAAPPTDAVPSTNVDVDSSHAPIKPGIPVPKVLIPITAADSIYLSLTESQRLVRLKTLQIIQSAGFSVCDTPSLNTLAEHGLCAVTEILARSELRASTAQHPRLLQFVDIAAVLSMSASPVSIRTFLKYVQWRSKQPSLTAFLDSLPSIKSQSTSNPSVTPAGDQANAAAVAETSSFMPSQTRVACRSILSQDEHFSPAIVSGGSEWPLEQRPEWLEPNLAYPAPPPGFEHLVIQPLADMHLGSSVSAGDAGMEANAERSRNVLTAGTIDADLRNDILLATKVSADAPPPLLMPEFNVDAARVDINTVGDSESGATVAPLKSSVQQTKTLPVLSGVPSFVSRDPVTGKPQWHLAFLVPTIPEDLQPFKPATTTTHQSAEVRGKFGRHTTRNAAVSYDDEEEDEREARRRRRKAEKRGRKRDEEADRHRSSKHRHHDRDGDRHHRYDSNSHRHHSRHDDRDYNKRAEKKSKHKYKQQQQRSGDDEQTFFSPPAIESRGSTNRSTSSGAAAAAAGRTSRDRGDIMSPATPATEASSHSTTTTVASSLSSGARANKKERSRKAEYTEKREDYESPPATVSKSDGGRKSAVSRSSRGDEAHERAPTRTPPEPIRITLPRPPPVIIARDNVSTADAVHNVEMKASGKSKKRHQKKENKSSNIVSSASVSPDDESQEESADDAASVVSNNNGDEEEEEDAEQHQSTRELSVATTTSSSNFEISDDTRPAVMQDEIQRLKQELLKDILKGQQQPARVADDQESAPSSPSDDDETDRVSEKKKKKKKKHAKQKRLSRDNKYDHNSEVSSPVDRKATVLHAQALMEDPDDVARSSLTVYRKIEKQQKSPSSSESESIIDPYDPENSLAKKKSAKKGITRKVGGKAAAGKKSTGNKTAQTNSNDSSNDADVAPADNSISIPSEDEAELLPSSSPTPVVHATEPSSFKGAKIPKLKIKMFSTETATLPETTTKAASSPAAVPTTRITVASQERESPLSPEEEQNTDFLLAQSNTAELAPAAAENDEKQSRKKKDKKKKKKRKKDKKRSRHHHDSEEKKRTPPNTTSVAEDEEEIERPETPPPVVVVVAKQQELPKEEAAVKPAAELPKGPLKLLLKWNNSKKNEQPAAVVTATEKPEDSVIKNRSKPASVVEEKSVALPAKKKKRARSPSVSLENDDDDDQMTDSQHATTVNAAPATPPDITGKSPPATKPATPAAENDAEEEKKAVEQQPVVLAKHQARLVNKKTKLSSSRKRSEKEEHERSQAVDLPLESSTSMRLSVKQDPRVISAVPSPSESAVMSPAPSASRSKVAATSAGATSKAPPAPTASLHAPRVLHQIVGGVVERVIDPNKWFPWPPPPGAIHDPEKHGYPVEWLMEYSEDGQFWTCPTCTWKDNGKLPMVGCDLCEEWFHYPCVKLRFEPQDPKWFCPHCRAEPDDSKRSKKAASKKRAAPSGGSEAAVTKQAASKKRKR